MENYIVETRNLKKYYQQGTNTVKALDGVDFRVKAEEFVAIIGKSGSGKSTLLHMIGGLDVPTSGSVIVGGKNLAGLTKEQLAIFRRRKIGFVFQSYNLVQDLNVYENIILPVELDGKRVDHEFVQEIMELLQLEERREALPSTLSGGQQQRVAVAVSMICGKDLLVFDEPTSGLDFDSMTQVAELIRRLSELGKVIFIVTHDFEFVCRTCSRVLHFDEGEMPDDIPVVMDALPKLRELFSVKVNGSEGDREGGLGHSDGKER